MLILAISDIHGSKNAKKIIKKMITKYNPDILIIAGDITHYGPLDYGIDLLNSIDIKTLAIPGNCDPEELINEIDKSKAINLHLKKIEMDNLIFIGIGGSNITPMNTIFELTEDEIFESLDKTMTDNAILVTHAPPKNHLDIVTGFGNVGSESILKIVEKFNPRLVICGHIHEARGIEFKDTIFVNPGCLALGYGALIKIKERIEVKLIKD